MTDRAASVLTFADLREGMEREFDFTVNEAEMESFAVLSGDYNPLHRDDAFARKRGFEGRVVYGALLIAKLSRLIGMELPGRDALWNSVQMQFSAPLFVGKPARLNAKVTQVSEAARCIGLQVTVTSEGKTIARGKSFVTLV